MGFTKLVLQVGASPQLAEVADALMELAAARLEAVLAARQPALAVTERPIAARIAMTAVMVLLGLATAEKPRDAAHGEAIIAEARQLRIIGAGAAGITLARQFSGQPYRVAVVESGDLTPDSATQALYDGASTGLPYYPLAAARPRMFGGTTNHWGGTCRPFSAIDLEARDWIPYSGWPIRLDDVLPYYDRARNLLGRLIGLGSRQLAAARPTAGAAS